MSGNASKAVHKESYKHNIHNKKKQKIMKKLVFAAIAAMVMVSVSNVFASNKMASVSSVTPVDTVAPADSTTTDSTVAE